MQLATLLRPVPRKEPGLQAQNTRSPNETVMILKPFRLQEVVSEAAEFETFGPRHHRDLVGNTQAGLLFRAPLTKC